MADEILSIDKIIYFQRQLKRGESLFRIGDEFRAIYVVNTGYFKSCMLDGDGREQVLGFSMRGDILGLDALSTGRYEVTAVALEAAEVRVLPFATIEEIAQREPTMQRRLHAALAREIGRSHGTIMLLGCFNAQQRLAACLLNLSERLETAGGSASVLYLAMTRAEIGSYLGLTVETVSRLISKFARQGFLEVEGKRMRILDVTCLKRVLCDH